LSLKLFAIVHPPDAVVKYFFLFRKSLAASLLLSPITEKEKGERKTLFDSCILLPDVL